MTFHFMDVEQETKLPSTERRDWLFGWGFSYVFTRSAWEIAPFPDTYFAEDIGFAEGLMARGVPVGLIGHSEEQQEHGLISHTLHPGSTTGQEFKGFRWNGIVLGKAVTGTPKAFEERAVALKYRSFSSHSQLQHHPAARHHPAAQMLTMAGGWQRKFGQLGIHRPGQPPPGISFGPPRHAQYQGGGLGPYAVGVGRGAFRDSNHFTNGLQPHRRPTPPIKPNN